ncbi:spore coat polysaccharide biosynthesis protein SpsB [Compostibacillus humi]|uniref:Spore coat polysaccharide biosynthesis protein SpsB n=1 Tax=Compostibacillus humi TaxID=1245525 RepID=A0A8J2XEH2_9BACI|nr:hypothetical protein [Compostibacillus humi]GFZ77903.1 spore coat polysaccharide biosynthesis protein SpsB [Compostibacillus humi]
MNTYIQNYWSLYLEFINDFQELIYKGYSLPYLCHFPSLIRKNREVWGSFRNVDFTKELRKKVKDQKEVQELFDQYIKSYKRYAANKNSDGKIVIQYDSLLRIPKTAMAENFDSEETVLLFPNAPRKNKGKQRDKFKLNSYKPSEYGPESRRMTITTVKEGYSLPAYYLSSYTADVRKAVYHLQHQAKKIFESKKEHPLYKHTSFQTAFLKQLSAIIQKIEQTKAFLDEVKASCIIVSSTLYFNSRVLVIHAAERGIPTVCLQHGIIGTEFGYIPKMATIDAVYGNYEKDFYKKLGVPERAIEIVGHPRFDQAFTKHSISRLELHEKLGMDCNKKTLLLVVRGNRDIDNWRELIRNVSKTLDINILVRNYPKNNTPHLLTKEFAFVHSSKNFELYDLLRNVNGVVSYSSTVGLEAMLLNKPVFILHLNAPSYTDYYENLGQLFQTNPKKLSKVIIRYFRDPVWQTYAKEKREEFLKYAYPDFTHSGERLKKLINRIKAGNF